MVRIEKSAEKDRLDITRTNYDAASQKLAGVKVPFFHFPLRKKVETLRQQVAKMEAAAYAKKLDCELDVDEIHWDEKLKRASFATFVSDEDNNIVTIYPPFEGERLMLVIGTPSSFEVDVKSDGNIIRIESERNAIKLSLEGNIRVAGTGGWIAYKPGTSIETLKLEDVATTVPAILYRDGAPIDADEIASITSALHAAAAEFSLYWPSISEAVKKLTGHDAKLVYAD